MNHTNRLDDDTFAHDPKNEQALADAHHRIATLTQRAQDLTDALIEVWSTNRPILRDPEWSRGPSSPGDIKFHVLANEARTAVIHINGLIDSAFKRLGIDPEQVGPAARARRDRQAKLDNAARLRAEADRLEREAGH